ncbi:hypothetical protein D3C81_205480 [compost metagenome]
MKKYVAGFIAGIVFMVSASAFADTFSLIGKKVTGEYKIVVNDKALVENGAVINSRANVPARALSEALGATVSVDNLSKTIFITSNESVDIKEEAVVPNDSNAPKATEITKPTRPASAVESEIKTVEIRLLADKDGLITLKDKIDNNPSATNIEQIKESYENLKNIIAENEAKLVELRAELAELEK